MSTTNQESSMEAESRGSNPHKIARWLEATCSQAKVDLDSGFDLYVETYREGRPSVSGFVRQKVDRPFLAYVAELQDVVVEKSLLEVRSSQQPGSDHLESSHSEADYWVLEVDDEGFRFAPDFGADGVTSVTVFLPLLMQAIDGEADLGMRWQDGDLLVCNQGMEVFVQKVEEFKAQGTRPSPRENG